MNPKNAALILSLAGGLTGGLSSPATARGTLTVPGDAPTIQIAINLAVNGDEVVVAEGEYFENIDFLGKAITLRSSGGPDVTTIDALGQFDSAIHADSGEGSDTVIEGFTITGGDAPSGGGLYISGSSPTVRNCIFTMNDSGAGGALYANAGAPTIEDCVFDDNFSTAQAGAIYLNNADNTQITGCQFFVNVAGTGGGAISNWGSSNVTIRRSEFRNNDAATDGDGIYNVQAGANLTVVNSVFDGAGIDGAGSAFFNGANAVMKVRNCTSTDTFHNSNFGTLTVTNCIVWNASISTGGTETVSYSMVQGGYSGSTNIDPAEGPLFVDEAAGDLRLQETSAAVDAGNSAAATTFFPAYAVDLDGNSRVVDTPKDDAGLAVFSLTIDMGAYEFQPGPVPPSCPTDINGDGDVNVLDLIEVLLAFGTFCP